MKPHWKGSRLYFDPQNVRITEEGFSISKEDYKAIIGLHDATDIKYSGIPNVCFSLTDPGDSREKKFKIQRKRRGFDDSETWSLDSTIIGFVLPRLKIFKELTCGYPSNLKNSKAWDRRLGIMIRACEEYERRFEHDVNNATIARGSALFVRYFGHLWW